MLFAKLREWSELKVHDIIDFEVTNVYPIRVSKVPFRLPKCIPVSEETRVPNLCIGTFLLRCHIDVSL